jgi:hypothetical protein
MDDELQRSSRTGEELLARSKPYPSLIFCFLHTLNRMEKSLQLLKGVADTDGVMNSPLAETTRHEDSAMKTIAAMTAIGLPVTACVLC